MKRYLKNYREKRELGLGWGARSSSLRQHAGNEPRNTILIPKKTENAQHQ